MFRPILTLFTMFYSVIVFAECTDDIAQTTPDSRFTINANGTATDHLQRLVWTMCPIGSELINNNCSRTNLKYDWHQAIQIANDYSFSGRQDWRLPNIKELQSINESSCFRPSMNTNIFPYTALNPTVFWSSTLDSESESDGVKIDFTFNTKTIRASYTDSASSDASILLVYDLEN